MHERSLVAALLEQVARIAREQGSGSVRAIRLQVGELAGVEPLLIESAFHELKVEAVSPRCVLTMRHVPLTARCGDCGREVILERLLFQCPACRSTVLDVTGGDAVRLESIDIEEATIPS